MPDDTLALAPVMGAPSAVQSHAAMTLMDLPIGATARVRGLRQHAPGAADLVQRLLEIGFVEGEPLRVVAHGHPGREPVAVRIGGTTFALRRFEAEHVLVQPETSVRR